MSLISIKNKKEDNLKDIDTYIKDKNSGSSASIDDNTTSTDKTWSSKKIDEHLNNIANQFTHEQTSNSYKIKYGDTVIANIPLGGNVEVTSYAITNNLTNCSSNNSSTSITEGKSYSATLTANSGYELSSVTVSMNGEDITSSCYSDGVINISSVTGDIIITAIATIIVVPSTDSTLTWNFENETAGNGYGAITMSVGATEDEGDYTIKYADDTGALSNYADICTLSPTVDNPSSYTYFNKDQLIPKYATKLLAIKDDTIKAEFAIPLNKQFANGNYGEHLYSFGAISDIHLSIDTAESDLTATLQYLNNKESVAFTCVSGDCTNNGTEEQLTTFKTLVDTNSPNTDVIATNGNHELYNTSFSNELWNTYVKNTRDYVFTHGNDVLIMFGITGGMDSNAFTTDQKTWLENLLAKYSTARVFLFVHPFIHNTGHGNYNNLYTNIGLNATGYNGKWLLNLLKQYKNVMLFNGHSHLKFITQELSSTVTVCNEVDSVETGYMLHIPSITAPREITGGAITDYLTAQSEGVVIDVYENCILYRGRNFVDEKFIPIGQYILPVVQGSITKENYTVTNNLSNCTTNNIATSVIEGNSYSAILTANSNYELSSVTVNMGGTDITSTVYSNGVISIDNVTGDIVIIATATSTLKPCTNIELNNSTLSCTSIDTQQLTATVTPSDTSDSITFESSDENVATVDANGVVTPMYPGTCVITAKCGEKTATCNVTVDLTKLTNYWEDGSLSSSTGANEMTSKNRRTKGFIPVSSNNTYYLTQSAPLFTSDTNSIKSTAIYCYDSNKNYISRTAGDKYNGAKDNYFRNPSKQDITSIIFAVSNVAYIRIRFSAVNDTSENVSAGNYDDRVILEYE